MRYPKRSPYLIYKRVGKNGYKIEHYIYGEEFLFDRSMTMFLRRLDGKHDPYKLLPDYSQEEVRRLLKKLDRHDLLAPKKEIFTLGIGSFVFPVLYCYTRKIHRIIAKVLNLLLLLQFLPIFFLGLFAKNAMAYQPCAQNKWEFFLGLITGAVICVIFHELAHTIAGLACNARIFEIGVGMEYFLPIGYVLMDTDGIHNKFKKIQINAAGIEMNMLLYGILMTLISTGIIQSFLLYCAGIVSITMAIINSLPLRGLDGLHVLSEIFGQEDLLDNAKKMIRKRFKRKDGVKTEKNKLSLAGAYALVGFQVLLPVLMFLEGYNLVRLILL